MSSSESIEIVIRSIDEEVFISETGKLPAQNDIIALPENVQVTITEKMMPLDSGLYIFFSMAVAFAAGVGNNVLANLLSDWIKEQIQKWGKRKPSAKTEMLVVILIFDNTPIEFWIVDDEVEIRYSRK